MPSVPGTRLLPRMSSYHEWSCRVIAKNMYHKFMSSRLETRQFLCLDVVRGQCCCISPNLLLIAVEKLLLSAALIVVDTEYLSCAHWWGLGIVFSHIQEMTEVLEQVILCYSCAVRQPLRDAGCSGFLHHTCEFGKMCLC